MKTLTWLQRNVEIIQFAKTSQAMMSLFDLIVEQEKLLSQLEKVITDRETVLPCEAACSAECEAGGFAAAKEAKEEAGSVAAAEKPKEEGAVVTAASTTNQSRGKDKASRPQTRNRLPRKCKSSVIQASLVLLVIFCAGTPAAVAKGGVRPPGLKNPAKVVVQASSLAKAIPKLGKPKISRGILNSVFNRNNADGIMQGLESSANFFDLVKTVVKKFKAKGNDIEHELHDIELFECKPRNGGLCYSTCARTQNYKQKWCHVTSTLDDGAWDVCDCVLRPIMRRWIEANKAKLIAVAEAKTNEGEEAAADLYTQWIIISTLTGVIVVAIVIFVSRCVYNYRSNNKRAEDKRQQQQHSQENVRDRAPRLDHSAMITGIDRTKSMANLTPTTPDNQLLTRPAKSMINLSQVGPPKHVSFEDTTQTRPAVHAMVARAEAVIATPPTDLGLGREE